MSVTTTDRQTQVRNVLALPSDDFRTLIENNLGHESHTGLWEILLHPQVIHRTHKALTARYDDVCSQLAERNAGLAAYRQECRAFGREGKESYFAANGEHQEWRRRALGYRRMLGTRIAQTKPLLAAATTRHPPNPNKKIRAMTTVFELGWAIRAHRDQCDTAGIVPEPHDQALWDALDLVDVETVDGPITVGEMLDDLAERPGFVPPGERGAHLHRATEMGLA